MRSGGGRQQEERRWHEDRAKPGRAWLCAGAAAAALSGCYVRESSGGYAAECELRDAGGWVVSKSGGLERTVAGATVILSTRHLYYSEEPVTLIEVTAYSLIAAGHSVRLDPAAVSLDIEGKRVRADATLRENPFMQPHWRCGGKFAASANLNDCGPAVLSFPLKAARDAGFVLHLGAVEIDGTAYPVPDIRYCYLPLTSKWVKFRG